MIVATRGIVLNYLKYRDTSIIVKIFTEKYGLKSFIVNGVRNQKAKRTIGSFQPLTLLDLRMYYQENRDLLRISELKIDWPTPDISQNIRKSTIALFLSEVLMRLLHHEHEENPGLFELLEKDIRLLNQLQQNIENFHLIFLVRLGYILGFGLTDPHQIDSLAPDDKVIGCITELIRLAENEAPYQPIAVSGDTRKLTLDTILKFYMRRWTFQWK